MNQTLSEIFEEVEAKNNFPVFHTSMIPKEFMYRKVGKSEMKKINEAVEALEHITDVYGLDILDTTSKTFVPKSLLKQQLIYNRLINDKKIDTILKEAILETMMNDNILTEGFIDSAKDLAGKAANVVKTVSSNIADAAEATVDAAKSTITNWMNVAVEEAKKVIITFAKAMGEFGKALVEFLKGFGDVDYKAVWAMIKDADFVGLAKSAGSWLIKRVADGIVLYQKIYETLNKGIFANLAGSKPVEALRNWIQKNLQDKLDAITDPNTSNPEIKKIIDEKYNGDIKAALNDKEVLRLTLADKGVMKTAGGLMFRTGIGTLLAYIAWETWNAMVFKGELIYDYDFGAALSAIAGNFNVADWFLSSDGGFETLLWLIAGKMGMGSLASSDTSFNIKLAVVVTLIMLWIKKYPETWKQIKNSAFAKKVLTTYEESKKRIAETSQAIVDKFTKVKNIIMKTGFIKKGGPAL